jgi:hypothetical protein
MAEMNAYVAAQDKERFLESLTEKYGNPNYALVVR